MPNIQLQFRRGTSTEWSNANTFLADGELAIETDTRSFKIGNGMTGWNSLSYGGLLGPQGWQGFTGPAGSGEGGVGTQGFQGWQGPAGSGEGGVGTQGPQGPQGNQGPQGFQGFTGPAGSGGGGFTISPTTSGNIVYANGTSDSVSSTANVFFNSGSNRLDVTAALSVQEVQELVIPAVPTTPYTIDWILGAIHYLTTIPSNLTVNITNLPTTSNRNYTVSVYLVQGGTPYYINVLQIAGSPITIKWSGGSAPTPVANRVEIQMFSLYYSGSAWTALSQLSSFG
jgi:hypothetical protein